MKNKTLDTSKYQDVITGTWNDAYSNNGSWTVNSTDIKGLYKPSRKGNSVDLFLDINKNGIIDSIDKKVGFAATANIDTGGSGTWNWSSQAKIGDYFGSTGQDAGQFIFTDKDFLKPGEKWDAVKGFLDTSKYQDVITGTWTDTSSYYGSWTVTGKDIQGLYKPSRKGNSVDLFIDINKNGLVDSTDKKVGFAATANIDTGGSGTWNWSSQAKIGDYFGSTGQDAGQLAFFNNIF